MGCCRHQGPPPMGRGSGTTSVNVNLAFCLVVTVAGWHWGRSDDPCVVPKIGCISGFLLVVVLCDNDEDDDDDGVAFVTMLASRGYKKGP